jgi:hypothetical protein
MEKRHYRNGYYVQRASVTVNNHESPQRTTTFPSNFALTDTSESVAYEDAHLTDASVRAVEKSTTDTSATTSQRHTSPCESRHVSGKNIKPIQLEQLYSQPNLNDEPGEKKDRSKLATVLIVAGVLLIMAAIIGFHPILVALAPIFLIVGFVLLSRDRKRRAKRDAAMKGSDTIAYQVKNAKPLWIASLIFLGLFLVCVVLAFTWEVLLVGVALSLPIALILAIVASIRERRNRKAYQSQSSQPPKERFRKLKKFFLWFAIILAAILVVGMIGFIASSGA